MIDFGFLPPEINSGRMYAGPGAGSFLEAATGWEAIAQELQQAAISYHYVLTAVPWSGPSAQAMRAAGSSYAVWLTGTAVHAETMAAQAQAAAAAFGAALAAVVPPPLIAANRALLAELVATNLLGQNTPAIMAAEAAYLEMWAQDAAAMSQYQATSIAATSALTPFAAAPVTANPTAIGLLQFLDGTGPVGSVLSKILGHTPAAFLYDTFQSLVGSGFPFDAMALLALLDALANESQAAAGANAVNAIPISMAPAEAGPVIAEPGPAPQVWASAGSSSSIGGLSAPRSWAQPQAPPRAASPITVQTNAAGEKESVGLPVVPAVPVAAAGKKKTKGTDPDSMDYGRPVPPILNRHPSGG